MKNLRRWSLVTLSLFFLWLSPAAQAADYRYFSVLAEAMRPLDSTIGFDCHEGYLKTTTDSSLHSTQYIAQINLPHSATIDSVSCYGYDNDSLDFTFALYRYRFNGEGVNTFEQITDEGDSGIADPGYVDLTVSTVYPVVPSGLNVINNEDFSYGLYLNLPAPAANDLYVVRFVVRAKFENLSSFSSIEIK